MIDADEIYRLEKKRIKQEKQFTRTHVKPKPIRIVDSEEYYVCALPTEIHISRGFLEKNPSRKEVVKLLKHELLRYVHYGHSVDFLDRTRSWDGFKQLFRDLPNLTVGYALKRLREKYRISLKKLAKEVGISHYRLRKIEKTGDPYLIYGEADLLRRIFETIIGKLDSSASLDLS